MTDRQREHQRQRPTRLPWRWATAVLLACAPLAALASPVVPLQGVTLVSQGNFDRGCTQDAQSNDCQHGCAFVGERLYCWGDYFGALIPGAPSVTSLAEWVRRPDRPSGDFDRPVSLAVDGHSCVADAGGVWCWGPNQNGQLGVGDQAPRPQPTHVSGLPADIVQIALSPRHTCARSRSAGVWCWGANDQGQAGQPAAPQQLLPQRVPGLPAVVDHIALGGAHSCALADARVWCWGDNAVGQLGDGLEDDHSTAQLVSGLPANVSELDAGWRHTCALMSGGDIWCWGENALGETGVPRLEQPIVRLARRVEGLPGPALKLQLATAQSCTLVDGRRWCWGVPDRYLEFRPTQVRELPRIDGAPRDWLDGCYQQGEALTCARGLLGYPYELEDARRVPSIQGQPVQLALGRFQVCARYADGAVACWENGLAAAIRMPIPPATDLAAGRLHACAATADGVWCWGDNVDGALGDGTTDPRAGPVRARFGGTRVAAGDGHSCAWGQNDGLHCWGRNESGQVSGIPSSAPVPAGATPLGNVVVDTLAVGAQHSCATLALPGGTEETRCWGRLPLNAMDLSAGVVDFSPRVVPAGSALPGEGTPRLRAAGFTACVGDRCYGLNMLPPDRGEDRVATLFEPPTGASTRALGLGGALVCVQGQGTDVRCVPLSGPVCRFDQHHGEMYPGCLEDEARLSAEARGWRAVVGLPGIPRGLAVGERLACAIVASDVWCWGFALRVPAVAPEPVYRAGAIEPAPTVAVALDAARACPAYLVSSVSLLNPDDASAAGHWGLDLLLGNGSRLLHGGLNFGGYGSSAGTGVPGYAAFSIQNPQGPSQRVTLDLSGDGGEFVLTVESTLPPSTTRTLELREHLTLSAIAQRRTLTLANGFHIVGLQPLQGTRLFLAAIGTTQPNGDAAAFAGGAVVGGWLEGTRSGFAGICAADASNVQIHTQARSTRGAAGAGDLRLQVLEGQTGIELYDSAD